MDDKRGVAYGDPFSKNKCAPCQSSIMLALKIQSLQPDLPKAPGSVPETPMGPVVETGTIFRAFADTCWGLQTTQGAFGKKGLSKRQAPMDAFFSQVRVLPLQKINSVVQGYSPGWSLSKRMPKKNV